ncbi:MLP-like protein 28 [Trifolium pratense]|uniref:MLP-like protein 28 n=1 Tax=Trifolium pratense TaxID=57577 RepID=UPI001E694BDF|nr:MLP-like protein 28 [Trifolium pratense]
MALIGKVETEVEIQAPASKFYNFYRKQLEHLPNISTHIHGARVHEGDWETVGSVKHYEYTIDGKKISATIIIESIDDDNKVITYSIIDKEVTGDYKSLKGIIQVIDKEHGGGGIVKWAFEYEKLKEDITGVSPESYLDLAVKVAKEIDAHLVKE